MQLPPPSATTPNATPTPQPGGTSAADLAAAILAAPSPATDLTPGVAPVGRQYGVVVSVQLGTPPTLTITLAGSTVPIAGVRYVVGYAPSPGDTVLVDQVGSDLIVSGALASGAVGPNGGLVPVGAMFAFPKAFSDPAWLLCNGGTFSAVSYPALSAYLGGTTLPDARGVALIGAGVNGVTLGGLDLNGNIVTHTHTGAAHTHTGAAHTHTGAAHAHSHSHGVSPGDFITSAAGILAPGSGGTWNVQSNTSVDATSTTPGAGGNPSTGTSTANVPPNYGVNVYVRAL